MNPRHFLRFVVSRWLPLLVLAFAAAAAGAQQDLDPPARVASLSQVDGSVAIAPAGETEWADAVLNRPITRGDRLWTDRGARAELHLGSAVLHIDSQTFLDLTDLDDDVLQASLNEGTVNARVRELVRGENFEIDTPQLAFRASRPGDYRVDVDPSRGTTRVTVRSGAALVYGASGQGQELVGGQVVTFAGTDLERVTVQGLLPPDGFDRWAADRNRAEDESIAARYIPRDVVGYHQLDPYGSWAQEASYGAVWYPRITVTDWAPYRYGRWEFIAPWGWTWIDDAPWGFAPFHYGRWAVIGSRWAWVPGRIGPRPVYAPALVVFVGGTGGVSISLSIGSGIGWFPLAPGEAWRPYYRTSPRYVASVNRYVVIDNQVTNNYFYINQRRPSAVTAVALEDFSRGRPVHRSRRPLDVGELDRVRIATQPTLPEPRRIVESRPSRTRALPPPTLSAAPVPVQPRLQVPGPAARRRDADEQRPLAVPRPQLQGQQQLQREQERAAREQERLRRDPQLQQERIQRDQQMQVQRQQDEQRRQQQVQREQERAARQQERAQQDEQRRQQQAQREQLQMQRQQDDQRRQQQVQREQERAAREQERAQREQQMQVQRQQQVQREQDRAAREQERARRDQQMQQERVQREQQLQAQRDHALRQQQAQERAQRQQQAGQEQAVRQQQAQERAQQQQQAAQQQQQQQMLRQQQQQRQEQQRALRQQPQPQVATPPEAPPAPRERGRGRPEREQRDDNRSPGGEEGGRGRGQGRAG